MHCHVDTSPAQSGLPTHLVNTNTVSESPIAWYVAYTESRQESLASANLQQQGFLTYLPVCRTTSKKPITSTDVAFRKAAARHEPMFPRYLFFKPASHTHSISSVRSTRGVSAVLRFGSYFAQVQPETLAVIRHHEEFGPRQDASAGTLLESGSRVRLANAAMNGLEGLVHSVSAQRVIVLMEILGRETKIKLRPHQLEPT